jgi:hypothetical protein
MIHFKPNWLTVSVLKEMLRQPMKAVVHLPTHAAPLIDPLSLE